MGHNLLRARGLIDSVRRTPPWHSLNYDRAAECLIKDRAVGRAAGLVATYEQAAQLRATATERVRLAERLNAKS
jgi:hypothetical protein